MGFQNNQIEERSKQRKELELQQSLHLTDELKNELLNVDLSKFNAHQAKIHPESESLFQFTQRRVTEELGPEFKLSKDLCDFFFYAFSSLSYDLLSCILIFNMAAFVLDDYLDKFPSENETVVAQLRTKQFPGDGFNEKWWQLCVKVCKGAMSETATDQLFDRLILCVYKSVELNKVCAGQCTLSDSDFVDLRCLDSGAPHQFFLILIGAQMQLTNELKNDPNYLGLNKAAAFHVTLTNDLYSLRKEIRDESYEHNYVYVKMRRDNISAQTAVDELILRIYESEKMARMYGERLKENNDPNLSRYVDGMYDAMAGNHYWSTICKRYNKFAN